MPTDPCHRPSGCTRVLLALALGVAGCGDDSAGLDADSGTDSDSETGGTGSPSGPAWVADAWCVEEVCFDVEVSWTGSTEDASLPQLGISRLHAIEADTGRVGAELLGSSRQPRGLIVEPNMDGGTTVLAGDVDIDGIDTEVVGDVTWVALSRRSSVNGLDSVELWRFADGASSLEDTRDFMTNPVELAWLDGAAGPLLCVTHADTTGEHLVWQTFEVSGSSLAPVDGGMLDGVSGANDLYAAADVDGDELTDVLVGRYPVNDSTDGTVVVLGTETGLSAATIPLPLDLKLDFETTTLGFLDLDGTPPLEVFELVPWEPLRVYQVDGEAYAPVGGWTGPSVDIPPPGVIPQNAWVLANPGGLEVLALVLRGEEAGVVADTPAGIYGYAPRSLDDEVDAPSERTILLGDLEGHPPSRFSSLGSAQGDFDGDGDIDFAFGVESTFESEGHAGVLFLLRRNGD